MGVDAEILVRIRGRSNWLTEDRCAQLAYELASSTDWRQFLLLREGEACGSDKRPRRSINIVPPFADEYDEDPANKGRVVYHQDGPTIVAHDDEQFIKASLMGRYYGPGYERGDWPALRAVITWLAHRIPTGSVWYGGDSCGMCVSEMTPDAIKAIDEHWFVNGRRPYVRHDSSLLRMRGRGFAGTEAPICDLCHVPMAECGGSKEFDFWWCDGCGEKVTKHVDGRIARATSARHNSHPVRDANGNVQQRKSDW